MANVIRFFLRLGLLLLLLPICLGVSAATGELGSPKFKPTPEQPIGWRGDGTGRYPAATPPLAWGRTKSGAAYTTKNFVWSVPLPNNGVSSPVIVGDKIFLTTEVFDLVCLDKQTGRILWIRSCPEFEGLPEDELKATPAYAEKLSPLLPQLEKLNAEAVEALNVQFTGGKSAGDVLNKKRALEKKIQDEQIAIDKKKFDRYWGQGVFGFAGQTPTSDGKHVCVFFTTGVAACFDLDGKRLWIHHGSGGGSEHGNFASPILVANRLAVWANEMRGYDVATGKQLWATPAKANNTYGSMFQFRSGNDQIVAFQSGFFTRVSDGKALWGENVFGDSIETPIVEGGMIFANLGYPRAGGDKVGFKAFKIPTGEGAKLTPAYDFKVEWADTEVPVIKDKAPFERSFCASPLFVDGLIYRMTEGGGLIVNEAATGAVVYHKALPMKPRTQYWNWAGASSSPALAGKYISLMDNQGVTVIIEPGRQYKEVARNVIEESTDGKEQVQNLATPIFEGTRMYYHSPEFLFCIAEK